MMTVEGEHLDLAQALVHVLDDFTTASKQAEVAFQLYKGLKRNYDDKVLWLKEQIALAQDGNGKKLFSNDDKREAELKRQLETQYSKLVRELEDADTAKYSLEQERERTYQALVTHRSLLDWKREELAHSRAQLEVERAQQSRHWQVNIDPGPPAVLAPGALQRLANFATQARLGLPPETSTESPAIEIERDPKSRHIQNEVDELFGDLEDFESQYRS